MQPRALHEPKAVDSERTGVADEADIAMFSRWMSIPGLEIFFHSGSSSTRSHVKWFADYDLQHPPRSPAEIASGEYFVVLCLIVGVVMFTTVYIDHYLTRTRNPLVQGMAHLTGIVQRYFGGCLRLGVCAFFVAAASHGGFLLTPELGTEQAWVPVVHLSIAYLALLRRFACLAGLGIVGLYAYAVGQFGLYHMLDYPVFLGVAGFLIIDSLLGNRCNSIAQGVLRWSTGLTLLWAGVEKFAYPEWSYDLLAQRPVLTFGFSPEFFMAAAGFVEFCCAYLLLIGALSARVAALVLLFFFVSAIYHFGLIDAIGHAVIIVVLTILSLTENPTAHRFIARHGVTVAAAHTGVFIVVLAFYITSYHAAHRLIYGTGL